MPTIVDRDRTVALLEAEFEAIESLGAGLTEEQWAVDTCLPGWTVKDVVAHLIGTESTLLGEDPPSVDVPQRAHVRNAIAEANEVWIESMRSASGPEVLARFSAVTGLRMVALSAMSQADFDAPSWTPAGRDETYGRFMRIRHFDCFMHEQDIRSALGLPPRFELDDLRSALDEVSTGLGYIVGRRAALPDGSRVRIELTGPIELTYLVAVDGRASVVDRLDGPPTVGLRLPSPLFLRLTGGRDDGIPSDQLPIDVVGDPDLAAQLVANLAFTI